MSTRQDIRALLASREDLITGNPHRGRHADAAEGGCGVIGFASSVPVAGRHVMTASRQMHNRGNGKGGGIAAAGLDPVQMRVDPEVLRTHYLLQIAYLDEGARAEVERECVDSRFDIAQAYVVDTVDDYRHVSGLEVRPPMVVRYFARVKPEVLAGFAERSGLTSWPARAVEDELVFQNSFRLNQRYYASLGDKRAFVASHGRDLLVTKIVGYAEQAVEYYRMEDMTAHVWIAHQRYPTKGRVWHPGGAHPFIGMNEALVHNGDFANYHRVTEYLRQRNIEPLFLTDTEVSVLLFDLWDRVYGYPLEVVLEALAPTDPLDLEDLPHHKRTLYEAVQRTHLQGSPDGPWFFILARSKPDRAECQLLGITDTSMLRPQVFALYQGEDDVSIGLCASERQAINACLRSIAEEDDRIQPFADKYWNARGGSSTDGGAFAFTVTGSPEGGRRLVCTDKFGRELVTGAVPRGGSDIPLPLPTSGATETIPPVGGDAPDTDRSKARGGAGQAIPLPSEDATRWLVETGPALTDASIGAFEDLTQRLAAHGSSGGQVWRTSLDALTLLRDHRMEVGPKKRSAMLAAVERAIFGLLRLTPRLSEGGRAFARLVDREGAGRLAMPEEGETTLVVDAAGFDPEGDGSAARLVVDAHDLGWRHFVGFDWRGGRFAGSGLGPGTEGTRLDLYGDPGDYIASGIDGAALVVHGDAQDQVGQILKGGRLIIHGDVGQTFLYGAKGGHVFVLGSAAGRPLINAVGRPRVVINGTCLDYLAESFMAGDPLDGGGFAIVNGVAFDEAGHLVDLPTPYPGGNLFSLASGGAVYLRDPHHLVGESRLNGGVTSDVTSADWALVEPFLVANEALFGIKVERLLTVEGERLPPERVYRKVSVPIE